MEKIKYIIIGGGISGLSFANELPNDNFLIVEKENTLGGLCRTHYVKDYIWDYAGHFFHFSSQYWKKFFEDRMESDRKVFCKKNTMISYNNRLIAYPFQKNIHQLELKEFIECLYDLYFRDEKKIYSDFKEMLYGKFGKGITERFLKPYNEKLYACNLESLDQGAMGRFFPYADIDEVIKNMRFPSEASYNNNFIYPKRGAQAFVNILKKEIPDDKILMNSSVECIDIKKKYVIINGKMIYYEYLINTIPLNQFVQLCGISDNNILSYNKVLVFNIGFDRDTNESVKDLHWIYYPDKETVFYRIGFYHHILKQKKGSIYVEIGLDKNTVLDESQIQKYYQQTISDLIKEDVISQQKVEAFEYILISPGYVHINKESNEWVQKLMKTMEEHNIYSIGRYGSWVYCSMEDCMNQAYELAKKL